MSAFTMFPEMNGKEAFSRQYPSYRKLYLRRGYCVESQINCIEEGYDVLLSCTGVKF